MASRRDDPASVVVCAILQKISRATDGVAAENETQTVVRGKITAVLEAAAFSAERAAAEGRAATVVESDAMAFPFALHACACADADPDCMTARVRKALVATGRGGGQACGLDARAPDEPRGARRVRVAQRGLPFPSNFFLKYMTPEGFEPPAF